MSSNKPIRALHIFPLFGPDLPNGSERYAWFLSQALVDLRVDVDVYSTCSRSVRQKSGFTLAWSHDFPAGSSITDGLRITRFPTITMPAWAGWLAARLLDRHVHYARLKLGPVPAEGSPDLASYQHAIMASQAWWSNLLMVLSLGPVCWPLWRAVWRNARDYDVILVSFFPLLSIPAIVRIGRWRGRPVVVLPLFHANDLSNNSRVLGSAIEQASAVLSLTPHSAAYLKQIHPGCRPFEVGGGISLPDDGVSAERFRAKYDLKQCKILLCVGRKEEGKRYRVAMEAMDAVADPDAILILAGEDVDKLPVTGDRVLYLGRISQEDLWDAYEACDVVVFPSRFESFGFVIIEGWSRRKPVIGDSGCPAVASLIEDGADGFLCTDAASIADRINSLLADAALRAKFGQAGYNKVLQKYTWPAVAERVRAVYEDCLK